MIGETRNALPGNPYTTNKEGSIVIENVRPGSYEVEETLPLSGHILDTRVYKVDVARDYTQDTIDAIRPVLDIVNTQGTLKVLKVNEHNEPLQNTHFDIKKEGQRIGSVVTDSTGYAVMDGLEPGMYTLTETAASQGYVKVLESISFEIKSYAEGTPEAVEIKAVNLPSNVSFKKVDSKGKGLEGASFTLIDQHGMIIETSVSDAVGNVSFSHIEEGSYTIKEIQAPSGYQLSNQHLEVTVSPANVWGEMPLVNITGLQNDGFMNHQGIVEITKTDGNTNDVIKDVVFDLYMGDRQIGSYTTNDKGMIRVENLDPGDYFFQERIPAVGYFNNTDAISFTIETVQEGSLVKSLTHKNYKARLAFTKRDRDDMQKGLPGAIFKLTQDGVSMERSSDETGRVVFEGLKPGAYTLEEIKAPVGYQRNAEVIEVKLDKESINSPYTFELDSVYNQQGTFTFTKTNPNYEGLSGVRFRVEGPTSFEHVYSDEMGIVTLNHLEPGHYTVYETESVDGFIINTTPITFDIPSVKGPAENITGLNDFRFINTKASFAFVKQTFAGNPLANAIFNIERDGIVVATQTSDKNGVVMFEDLIPGSYRITESNAPEGYIRNTSVITFIVPESSSEGRAVAVKGLSDDGRFINDKASLNLIKTDEKGNTLEGAIFEIRDASGAMIAKNLKTDKNGLVSLEHELSPGVYDIYEVKAPKGYILNTKPVRVEVLEASATGMQVIEHVIRNNKGLLEITKVDPKDQVIGEATFEVFDYEGISRGVITTVNGVATLDGLEPGTYAIKEISSPEGYERALDELVVEIPETSDVEKTIVSVRFMNEEIVEVLGTSKPRNTQVLPKTGISQTVPWFGAVLILAGVILLIIRKFRNRV